MGAATLDRVWLADVLGGINAPATQSNEAILSRWAHWEGCRAAWNPMATEWHTAGSTRFNSAGVQNYPDEATGAAATARTLLDGHYWPVVAALRASAPVSAWHTSAIRAAINTWGTHGFSRELS